MLISLYANELNHKRPFGTVREGLDAVSRCFVGVKLMFGSHPQSH